jgi:hypothetical protein
VSVLWNALAAIFLFFTLRKIGQSPGDAMLGAIVYSFGTLVFPFGGSVWGHTTSAAFIVLSLFFWVDATAHHPHRAGVSRSFECASASCGFFAACALLTDYLAGVIFLLVGATFVLNKERWRGMGYFALGSIVPLGVLLSYQQIYFGSFLTTATSLSNPILLEGKESLFGSFGSPSLRVIVELLFLPSRGLLPFMPIAIMCSIGMYKLIQEQQIEVALLCFVAVITTIFVVSSFVGWHGGLSAGPRYLIIIIPFIALLLPPFSSLRPTLKAIYILTAFLSILNMWIIASTTVLVGMVNPLYGHMYAKFVSGRGSAQALEMFLGWIGPWSVLFTMGAFLTSAVILLRNARKASIT